MQLTHDALARGTRVIIGEEAEERENYLDFLKYVAKSCGFMKIELPVIELASLYEEKAGKEVLGQMYTFHDKSERVLCLRPECTATIQKLADIHWKSQKDVKLWYFERCYRYEKPQAGRYREFYQFGLEWINPSNSEEVYKSLLDTAKVMVKNITRDDKAFEVSESVKRGLSYYIDGKGFEISIPSLGAQKQVVGGGFYKQGVGFALGFDRILTYKK